MPAVTISRAEFLKDRQGRTFADVLNDPELPFDQVLQFFSDEDRQRRMEDAEIHHDRPPLAGVVRELEAQPAVDAFLAKADAGRSKRLRQAIGVIVRMVMEGRGWRKTGRKGSLGVRAATEPVAPRHNAGGLAFWFIRAERYQLKKGMPFRSVKQRRRQLESALSGKSSLPDAPVRKGARKQEQVPGRRTSAAEPHDAAAVPDTAAWEDDGGAAK